MNKRGVSPVYWILETVFAIAVLVIAINMAYSAATGEQVRRIVLAKDLALTIDTLYAAPGDITINYATDKFYEEQMIIITNNSVSVPPETYSFTPDLQIKLSDTSFKLDKEVANNIIITKKGDEIEISKE